MIHVRPGENRWVLLPCRHQSITVSADIGTRTKRCKTCRVLYRVELLPSAYLSRTFVVEIAPVELLDTGSGSAAGPMAGSIGPVTQQEVA